MANNPLIENVRWIDLSPEHKKIREDIEHDLRVAYLENGHIQPIMVQGAFGIGKTTLLYYLFHYGWEVLKTPTFFINLSKIVDEIKDVASKSATGKVENDQLSVIIKRMLDSQISILEDEDWDNVFELDFPEFTNKDKGKEDMVSLTDYIKDFKPVELDIDEDSVRPDLTLFSEQVIKEALATHRTPLLLVDEFESKFYELKRVVESSGGGILRALFDDVLYNKPFLLVIGNGPASGYEVAKEKGTSDNNDSETAANRRLKTMQIPFPTSDLLKQKFMRDCTNGYVNFIWWLSRCRPGHIQKLWDGINHETYKNYKYSDFIAIKIFNEPVDEGGEDVKYLKTSFFNDEINNYIKPIVGHLLLDFEPQNINLEETFKDAMKDSENARWFYCAEELVSVEKELLPALNNDLDKYLKTCQSKGKFSKVQYDINLNYYFNHILSACANKEGEIAFGTTFKNPSVALADSFLIPLLELTYDFISQYEDGDTLVIRHTKDFILDSIKHIENSVKSERVPENFPDLDEMFTGIKVGKVKSDDDFYLQFSLWAIREFIEQPIGSPKLKYKDMSLDVKLAEADIRRSVLLTNRDKDNRIIFIPVLEEDQQDEYLLRLKKYIQDKQQILHKDGAKTMRVVYLQPNEKIDELKNQLTRDREGELLPVAKLKKIVFDDYDNYQFNFGGQISDFIDSVAKIVIAGCSCQDIDDTEDGETYCIEDAINKIKDREWTSQKEVVRTIEHYGKLSCEGENSVVERIVSIAREDYENTLAKHICDIADYEDNITWDFNLICDATVTDDLSKYLSLYYVVECAQKHTEINKTLLKVLRSIKPHSGNLPLKFKDDPILETLHFGEIDSILNNSKVVNLLKEFRPDDDTVRHLISFTRLMKSEQKGGGLSDLFEFIKDDLNHHWIGSYNKKMSSSYEFPKGDLLMKLLYLHNYIEEVDFPALKQLFDDEIRKIGEKTNEIRANIFGYVDGINGIINGDKNARDKSEEKPFYRYLEELRSVSELMTDCKKLLSEEPESKSACCVVASVIERVKDIVNSAIKLTSQIQGLEESLSRTRQQIKREYQNDIDTIYEDETTAKLIELRGLETKGGALKYSGEWCWNEYIKIIKKEDKIQDVLKAELKAVNEDSLQDGDIKDYNNCLQSILTSSEFTQKMNNALEICRECQANVQEYNQIYRYIDELLKFDE